MRMATLPICVVMQRRTSHHRWAGEVWSAVGVVPDNGRHAPVETLNVSKEGEAYLVSGLSIDLYPDEHEGYFENCIAPASKVFVKWRMEGNRAMPVMASVSYAEGTRMFDCGEPADGVEMPFEIHAWLAAYLNEHYQPSEHRGERHGRRARA